MNNCDNSLIQRTLTGDTDSFGLLVNKYQSLIYGLVYHNIGNFADAQDITQDVFIKSFRKLNQLTSTDHFFPWLKTIAVNECNMWQRQRKDTLPIDDLDDFCVSASCVEPDIKHAELHRDLYKALNSLSESNRLVFTLHYLTGLTNHEISISLEIPVTTVDKRLQRAREQLRHKALHLADVFEYKRLPEDFTEKVMLELSLFPIKDGWFTCARYEHTSALIMGAMQKGRRRLISLTMRHSDTDAVFSASSRHSEAGEAKHRTIDMVTHVFDSLNICIIRVALYLDDKENCRAKLLVKQFGRKKTIDIRASEALAMASRKHIPVYIEPAIIRKKNVSEDGLEIEFHDNLDQMEDEFSACNQMTMFIDRLFDLGLSPENGRDSFKCRRSYDGSVLLVEIDGLADKVHEIDSAEYQLGINKIFDSTVDGNNISKYESNDHNAYEITYKIAGDGIEAHFKPISYLNYIIENIDPDNVLI